jgi:hypothetical protein
MILQKTVKQLAVVFVIVVVMQSLTVAQFGGLDRRPPALPDLQLVRTRGGDSTDPMDKLSPELRSLYEQISNVQRGSGTKDDNGLDGFTASQLTGIFGISPGNPDPLVIVSVRFTSQSDLSVLKSAGASIIAQSQNVAYAIMPVKALNRLANVSSVSAIGVFTAMQMPFPGSFFGIAGDHFAGTRRQHHNKHGPSCKRF